MTSDTLASIFHRNTSDRASLPALRVKRDGAYEDVLWSQLGERTLAASAGFIAKGLQAGDRVAIMSENRLEWIEADFASLCAGGITVTLHAPLTPAQVLDQLKDAEPRIVCVSNQEQLEKLDSVLAQLPSIETIVAFEPSAARLGVLSWDELIAEGRAAVEAGTATPVSRIQSVQPSDIACISYTSGTTGESKGAMLTHSNLANNVRGLLDHFPPQPEDVMICYLPLSHIYARTCDLYMSIIGGTIIGLAECVDTLAANLQEIRPHHLAGVPRVHQKIEAATRPYFEAGHKDALKQFLGGRVRYVSSGGAAISPEVAKYYWDAGVPLFQGYGLTETSPVISFSHPGAWKLGSSGKALPGVEIKIADDGEILSRGPHIMKGYWRKPEATAACIDSDGWFHTGDLGFLDDEGFLTITERKKEIIVTSYGKNVAPQQLEGLLCFDPLIEQALVYGDDRPFLSAVIVPAMANLKAWVAQQGLSDKSDGELLACPEVCKLYEEHICEALKPLSNYEQVRKFILRAEPFSLEAGEVTLTAKLRRKPIIERHWDELEALYA
jgi:long-chain acyl-CoA synthetase